MDKPKSAKGVLVILAIVAFVALAIFASTWGGIAIIGVIVALGAYILYVSGLRIHRLLLGG